MPSATRSGGGRAPAGGSPGPATGRGSNATTTRGRNVTPRRGRNATTARGRPSPPATNERVTLASLAALVLELQAAQAAANDELREILAVTREEVAAEKGAVQMCHQLQNELDDYRRSDDDDHNEPEPATPVRRAEEKERYHAWRIPGVRKVSGGGGRSGMCYTWRDYGTCSFGTGCIYDHPPGKKHRPSSGHSGGSGRGGANNNNGGNGGGGGTTSGGRAKEGRFKPGVGASAAGSSGGGRIAARGGSTASAAPPGSA